MSVNCRWRGHLIYHLEGKWYYKDNDKSVSSDPERLCDYCKLPNMESGVDSCLGVLEGVSNACCGHGLREDSYIQFKNGFTIRGFKID